MMPRRSLAALAAATALSAPRAQAAVDLLVRFPNGTFLENLVVGANGTVLFTNYFARQVERWSPAAGHGSALPVSAHPVSLTALGGGRHALVAHGVPFNRGPEAMRGQAAVLLLNAEGNPVNSIALPEAIFPNGSLLLAPGLLLVVDSVVGCIWAVDLGTARAYLWYQHAALRPDAARPVPGVNGIKRQGESLLLSHSASRRMFRLALEGLTPRGEITLLAEMPHGVDDFCLAPDGTIYAATHSHGLARLAPGAAAPTQLAAPGLEGNTAVALTPDDRGIYVLGTGGMLEGGQGEAALGRVTL